jgi:anthranilate phosphoribosyltransferase
MLKFLATSELFIFRVSLSPQSVAKCLEQVGIAFLYAPKYHPSMKNVSNIRKGLRFRTAFNLLGPLTNPALVSRQVRMFFTLSI